MVNNEKILSSELRAELLQTLEGRFEKNMNRHAGLTWSKLKGHLVMQSDRLWSLHEMEQTGGEPDVVDFDQDSGVYVFFDCSAESPAGRRNLCYDHEALMSRKENKPKNSAEDMAAEMGIDLLSEEQYRALQQLGKFDLKTSSWVLTPPDIRKLGGALFCDRRYDHVFVYHNGAESYYGVRGFRGCLKV